MKFLLALLLGVLAVPAKATTIEGFTPSGNFQTVGVSDLGALYVNIVSTTPQHVITDTGSYTSIQGAVAVYGDDALQPVSVTGAFGAPVEVTGSFVATAGTAAVVVSGQISVTSGGIDVLAQDFTRKQSIICNNDPGATIWLGPFGTTTATGIPLGAGGCMSPDVPASFVGRLVGRSSSTVVNVSVLYFR